MKKFYRNLSKGKILVELEGQLNSFRVPKTKVIKVSDWLYDKDKILIFIRNYFFRQNKVKLLAIRSSAKDEDSQSESKAGMYTSVLNVKTSSNRSLDDAFKRVIKSYKLKKSNLLNSEIIVQEMILKANTSGVIFTNDMNNGSPYYIVNYDDKTGLTDTVTSGSHMHSNMCLNVFKNNIKDLRSNRFKKLLFSVQELEYVLGSKFLDIEFVINKKMEIFLLQVREISKRKILDKKKIISMNKTIKRTNDKFKKAFKKQKGVIGQTTVFGQMPDWNPAEMIGKFPRKLSFSLYKKLITDKIWLKAREKMGYMVPKNSYLMLAFAGQPYIDTRLSLNSFLPSNLPNSISKKLINFWLEKFKKNPILHDKIEFELAITCYSFDLSSKMKKLVGNNLNLKEKEIYKKSLMELTKKFLDTESNFSIKSELEKIARLEKKQKNFKNLGDLDQLNELIYDCKIFGTLPFSILARHGFVGITLLNSLEQLKIISNKEKNLFLNNIRTIATDMIEDLNNINNDKNKKLSFLQKYGHFRPGTYDIMSRSYDEMSYFRNKKKIKLKKNKTFKLKIAQKKLINKILKKNKFKDFDYNKLLNYIYTSISAREYSKFIFTKNISNILKVLIKYGKKNDIGRDQLSHIDIENFLDKRITKKKLLQVSLQNYKKFYLNSLIKLPQIIHNETNGFIAPYQINVPNFITSKMVEGKSLQISTKTKTKNLDGKIILIEGADPGYDWIFSHKVIGLITKFGGVNSHMAIRSAEFGLPAVIGCGENLFNELKNFEYISINCSSKEVKQLILN